MARSALGGLLLLVLSSLLACALRTASDAPGPVTLAEAADQAPEGPRRASLHLVVQASESFEMGDLAAARAAASRALRVDGRNPYAYLVLGQVAAASGESDTALRYLEQAQLLFSLDATLDPHWIARVLRVEAQLRSEAGEVEEAALLRRQADAIESGSSRPGSVLSPVIERQP